MTGLHKFKRSCLLLGKGRSVLLFLDVRLGVFQDFRDDACSNGFAAFSERKALSLMNRKWEVQLHLNRNVVTWQCHLHVGGKLNIGS